MSASEAAAGGRWRDRLVYNRATGRFVLAPIASWAYGRHARTGHTPRSGYVAMRKLYGADPAAFERLADRAAVADPPPTPGTGGLAAGMVDRIVATLRTDGYAVLPHRLDAAACDDLEATARSAPCALVGTDDPADPARFDEHRPLAPRYDVAEEVVVQSPAAQRLVADASLLEVAHRYLGGQPVQDLVAMWWSTPAGPSGSSAAAQRFHFDLDRLRFLKVFVFLTDVGDDSGPHVYVRGSHRHDAVPAALRRDGRHADELVHRTFGSDVHRIGGPRGTVFLADTRGLHKGESVRRGHRLVFQTEYATSLFGAPHTSPSVTRPAPELVAAQEAHPGTFDRLDLNSARFETIPLA